MNALQGLIKTTCLVKKNGNDFERINMEDVVMGDVVKLTTGDIIPADIKLISAKDFFVSQSALTEESEPIEKHNKIFIIYSRFNKRRLGAGILNKILKVLLNIVVAVIISFFIYRFMTLRLIDLMPFNQDYLIDVYLGVNIIQSILIFIILNSIYNRKINRISIIAIGILYFIVLIFVLFIRTRGVQGYELNLISSMNSWTDNPHNIFVALMNGLLFLPFAYIFKGVKVSESILIGVIVITLCEIIQYAFSLGIFDVGDIVLNSFGFILGTFLWRLISPNKIRL